MASAHDADDVGIAAGEAKAGDRPVAGPSRGPRLGAPLVEYLLRLGDDRLILGHRPLPAAPFSSGPIHVR
ncbi:MAG: hypothetical protein ACKORK_12940, partial [Gemmatimonadota bacterium]